MATIFIAVDVKERLPEKEDRYLVLVDDVCDSCFFNGKRFETSTHLEPYLTHWMERIDNALINKGIIYLPVKKEDEIF